MAITRVAAERRLLAVFQDLAKAQSEGKLEDEGLKVAYNTLGVLLGCMKVGEPMLGAFGILINKYAEVGNQMIAEAVGEGQPRH